MSQEYPLWRIPQWFKWLNEGELSLLLSYFETLCKWTAKVNLISLSTLNEADRLHFADSILGVQVFQQEIPMGERVWDLGSGNGLPGVILAILRPDLKVICLDSDERKVGFLMQLGLRLPIKNLSVKCQRLEKVDKHSMGFAVTRALAEVGKLLKICDSLFVPRGTIFHFKSMGWEKELENIPNALTKSWETEFLNDYTLPDGEESPRRCILRSQKR